MDNEYSLQEKEKPGEKEENQRRKREREEWERKMGGGGTAPALAPSAEWPAGRVGEYGGGNIGTARQYGQQAKEYLSDRASVVGDKITDLRNKDYGQMAEEAKDYARQNPGQALLVAAAAGFVLGLLLRGGRR